MDLFNLIMRLIFLISSIGALGYFVVILHDAYADLTATHYAKVHFPHLYRAADEMAARDMVRNNWYRFGTVFVILLVASIIVIPTETRTLTLNIVLHFLVVIIPLSLIANAVHERRAKTTLRKRVREEGVRAYK